MSRARLVPATLHGMVGSGNCYKPALAMHQLGIGFAWREVDLLAGETRGPAFHRLNPNGKVPVLEFADGRCLAESNAMLCALADGTPLFPSDPWTRAQVLQWLFFEQYSHEPAIATVRFWIHYLGRERQMRERIAETRARGETALAVMEDQLGRSPFIAGAVYTIADIALYAYTHVAGEGGYDLARYPRIGGWLSRVRSQPRHVSMSAAVRPVSTAQASFV